MALESRPIGASRVTLFVGAIVAMCLAEMLFVFGLLVMVPDTDHTGNIQLSLGVLTPIVMTLLGAAVKEMHTDVNSRLTEMLTMRADASKAEGELQEKNRAAAALPTIEEAVQALNKIEKNTEAVAIITEVVAKNTEAVATNTAQATVPTTTKKK